jgi:hypothetical protein
MGSGRSGVFLVWSRLDARLQVSIRALQLALLSCLLLGSVVHAQTAGTLAISGTPPASVTAGTAYLFKPTLTVPSGQTYQMWVENLPRWASFNDLSGQLSGTPAATDIGTYTGIRINLMSGQTVVSLPVFAIEVKAANRAPVIGGTPATTATVGRSYSFTPTASDADGDALSFSITNKPAWASFSTVSGRLSGTPGSTRVGTYSGIVIRVSDGQTSAALPSFTITVAGANAAPVISGTPPVSVTAGGSYAFTPVASDPESQPLSFSITGKPAWAVFDPATGSLSGTPGSASVGIYPGIVIGVSDGAASSALPAFSITVLPNGAPVIGGTPPTSATVGKSYSFRPTASDPEGDALTFSIVNKPAWASFTTSSGRIYGTPGSTRVGTYSGIRISVSDGRSTVTLPAFSITVSAVVSTAGSATVSWRAPTSNEDGSPLLNLAGFRIVYGTSAAALSEAVEIPSPLVTSAVIEGLPSGTWYFAVKAYTTAGIESDLSTIPYKIIP